MGFTLCFFGNERTSTIAKLSETSGMSVAAVGVFNIFSVHVVSLRSEERRVGKEC